MVRKEINEIKEQYTLENCNISRLCGCYVDGDKNKVTRINESFLNLPEEEQHKYFEIFRKNLSGTQGKNLIDMAFNENAYVEDGARSFLCKLRDSELKDEELLEEFYDKIIESYGYIGNYLILLIHQSYDVPAITNDNIEMEDASEEVYSYIMCSICPVTLSEAGLGYDELANEFHNQERGYMVKLPEMGFLFPAFTDRSEDRDNILFYTKSSESFCVEFMTQILDCSIPMPAELQKETFQSLITETLQEDCSYETVKCIHDNLNEVIREKKDGSAPVLLDKEEVRQVFARSGVAEEKLIKLDSSFDKYFDREDVEERRFVASNIMPAKKYEVKTPDVIVKFDAGKTDLVDTRVIDGVQCLVIKIDEGLVVNGIPVNK
ncbi:MAG: DUF4317 domain-containing protein [Wujia sp.]